MKITVDIELNLKDEELKKNLVNANRKAMRDTVVAVWSASIKPPSPRLTGHNRRSIVGEVSGLGEVRKGADAEPDKQVNDSKLEGAVYSTSGYGGFLETGTSRMGARPYMKPALDSNFTAEKYASLVREYL